MPDAEVTRKINFACPSCTHQVIVYIYDNHENTGDTLEAWCATKHAKPVKMERKKRVARR